MTILGAAVTIPTVKTDYLDRISIAVWAVTIALAASAVLRLPGQGASVVLGERSLVLPVAASSFIPVVLAALAGAGAEAVIRSHPLAGQGKLRLTARLWALPIAVTLIATLIVQLAPSVLYWVAGLVLFALLLGGVLSALYFSLDAAAAGYRRARLVLNLASYGIAVLVFLLVPDSWRPLARSAAWGGVALLLALELLRGTGARVANVTLYAIVVAVVVAETAWVLPRTGANPLTLGLLLLLLFYLLVGLAWQSLLQRLTRRVGVEFALIGLVGLVLILVFAS